MLLLMLLSSGKLLGHPTYIHPISHTIIVQKCEVNRNNLGTGVVYRIFNNLLSKVLLQIRE